MIASAAFSISSLQGIEFWKPTRYYSLNHKNEQRTGRTPASTTLNEISIRIRRLFVFY